MDTHKTPDNSYRLKMIGRSRAGGHLLGALLIISLACRSAEAVMNLPDGIENILGFVPTSSFQCERDGYFGDIENDCRLFHLCQKQVNSNGRTVSLGQLDARLANYIAPPLT